MKRCVLALFLVFVFGEAALAVRRPISEDTQVCINCHASVHSGIVSDWEKGRMAKFTPRSARSMIMKKRRVSFETISEDLARVVVGCAECHTLNPEKHQDTFDHNGYQIHVVVTPEDCKTCHPIEVSQYAQNLMSEAHGNLQANPVYRSLADAINSTQSFDGVKTTHQVPDEETNADSCLYCHGTVVEVKGMKTEKTDQGEMAFPVLSGWPNHGVGRVNPDGSKGSCTPCHSRHQFSIEMARKPYTCSECHKGPDVPAYKVYTVSKHGNIHSALGKGWNFEAVPWILGRDITAPTCAACHVSLLVSEQGDVLAERTHRINDRLSWRLFGLIYAHAGSKSADTTIIINKAGLPLPTELTGEAAAGYLIDAAEQEKRQMTMRRICRACHSQGWVKGHFARLENTIRTSNEMTLAATKLLLSAWENGAAQGLAQGDSIFDEAIEKKWVEQWLFFANSTRYASAMAGADYGVFANGRWHMSKNIQEMTDWLEFRLKEDR
jgi:hydroxylamine dehydrogenase